MKQEGVDTSSDINMINWLRDKVVEVIASKRGDYSQLMAGVDAPNLEEYMRNISWKDPTLKFLREKQLPLSKDILNAANSNQLIYWVGVLSLKPKQDQTRLEALQASLFPEVPRSAWGDEITLSVIPDVIKLRLLIDSKISR